MDVQEGYMLFRGVIWMFKWVLFRGVILDFSTPVVDRHCSLKLEFDLARLVGKLGLQSNSFEKI